MATQTGILGLKGTVGGLVFRKDGSVSQKPASNKAAFNSAASMERTRENASEFTRAANGGRLIREAFRVLIQSASDSRLTARLTQAVRAIISLDAVSDRGKRVVDKANVAALLGFNFNLVASLGQVLGLPYTMTANGADVTMDIPSLNPLSDVRAPQGATHYRLNLASAAINFETGAYQQGAVAAPLGTQSLTAVPQANVSMMASFAQAPGADDVVIGVVGVDFFQELNGKFYPLKNNATNPLSIEFID